VIRLNCPEPRGPTFFMGWVTREGLSVRSLQLAPFWQPRGLKSGTLAFDCP
jgi:hypothetical protein